MTKKEFDAEAARYLELSAKIKELEKERDELKAKLQNSLKDGRFETKQYRAWQTDSTMEKFCSKSFKEDHPKMYRNYVVMVERSNFYCKEV